MLCMDKHIITVQLSGCALRAAGACGGGTTAEDQAGTVSVVASCCLSSLVMPHSSR